MSLQEAFELIRQQADSVASKIKDLQGLHKIISDRSNTEVRAALQQTCNTIASTLTLLEQQGALPSTEPNETDDDDLDVILAAEAAALDLSNRNSTSASSPTQLLTKINASIQDLTKTVRVQLDRASSLKQISADVRDITKSAKGHVDKFESLVKSELADTKERLADSRKSLSQMRSLLGECQEMMGELNEDIDDNKTTKRVVNVGRIALIGTTMFLPGVGLAAAGLEYGAYKLRKNRKELKRQRDDLINTVNTGEETAKSLATQVSKLTTTEKDVTKLATSTRQQAQTMQVLVGKASDLETSLRGLDGACSTLVSRVRTMGIESEGMVNVALDGRRLREAVQRFTREALGSSGTDMREVCGPLMRLLG